MVLPASRANVGQPRPNARGVMLDLIYLGLGLAAVGLFVAYAAALRRL